MYALPQEKNALETFAGQRDVLMKDVALLEDKKTQLNSEIKQLVDSVTSARQEQETITELMKAQLKGEGALSEKVKATIDALKRDVDYLNKEKALVTTELQERTSFLQETSSAVEKISKEVAQAQNALTGIYQDINNSATWMKEAVVDIKQLLEEAKVTSNKFAEDFTRYEKEHNERVAFLDKKESLILARERAVDEKYLSYVKMAGEGLN
jgi:chromosome segregation ATPase